MDDLNFFASFVDETGLTRTPNIMVQILNREVGEWADFLHGTNDAPADYRGNLELLLTNFAYMALDTFGHHMTDAYGNTNEDFLRDLRDWRNAAVRNAEAAGTGPVL